MYKECWEHARHCEIQRLWFNNIYAVIVAAILVFLRQTDLNQQTDLSLTLLLALFALILSVLGLLVVITLSLGYEHYITDATMILYVWRKLEFYRHPAKPFHFKTVYRFFYEITIALFVTLLLYTKSQNLILLIVVFIVVVMVAEGIYRKFWKRYFDDLRDFRKKLKEDTGKKILTKWGDLAGKTSFEKMKDEAERLINLP